MRQNRDALLRPIRGEPPLRILDLGCGPGQDLVAFRALGHAPAGLDGALRFCEMARTLGLRGLALELPPSRLDGVFANASLFHVPTRELPRVLAELRHTLGRAGSCSRPTRAATTPRGGTAIGTSTARTAAAP